MDEVVQSINWAQVTVSVLLAVIGSSGFWSYIQKRRENKDAKSRMILGICHTMIMEKCEFYINRGWISLTEYEDLIKYLFEPYKDGGGNGTAACAVQEVSKLPKLPPESQP